MIYTLSNIVSFSKIFATILAFHQTGNITEKKPKHYQGFLYSGKSKVYFKPSLPLKI